MTRIIGLLKPEEKKEEIIQAKTPKEKEKKTKVL